MPICPKSFCSCISNLFQLQGPEHRRCEFNEFDNKANWSESIRSYCQPKCRPIETISNGLVTCSRDNLVESECNFECLDGHILDGNKNMVCQLDNNNLSSSWINENGTYDYPICRPICNDLKSPSNGKVTCSLSMTAPIDGDSCEFSCDLGFNLIGSKIRECKKADIKMQWEGSTTACEPTCDSVIDIHHGKVNCSNSNLIGSQCQYSCMESYTLNHEKLLSNANFNTSCEKVDSEIAKWSDKAPSCEPTCPTIGASIKNGKIICSGVKKGDSCHIECDESFNLKGMKVVECVSDPESSNFVSWNDEPGICEPTCLSTEPNQEEFFQRPDMNCTNNNLLGSECRFNCYQGSIIIGEEEKVCLKSNETNAEWSYPDPICEPVCDPIRDIENGFAICDFMDDHEIVKINGTCIISCDDGFQLDGTSILTCSTMNNKTAFDHEIPICLPKCQMLEDIQNGYVTCSNENLIGSKQGFADFNLDFHTKKTVLSYVKPTKVSISM